MIAKLFFLSNIRCNLGYDDKYHDDETDDEVDVHDPPQEDKVGGDHGSEVRLDVLIRINGFHNKYKYDGSRFLMVITHIEKAWL